MQGDREWKWTNQQTERVFHRLQSGRIGHVFIAIGLGQTLSLADDPVKNEGDHEGREDKQNNNCCDHIYACSLPGPRLTLAEPRSSSPIIGAHIMQRAILLLKIKLLCSP